MMTEVDEAAVTEVNRSTAQTQDETLSIVNMTGAAEKLSQGLLDIYQPSLVEMKNELHELLKKQESIFDKMEMENKHLTETLEDEQCCAMYSTIKIYNEKLNRIKREMATIHERTSKLKKRALRLQQMKQREALLREQKREEEIRREQELIGKPMSTS